MIGLATPHRIAVTRAETTAKPRAWVLPMAIALLGAVLRLSIGPLTIDDAYITMRYSRNIAEGLGFVYNPGQHVLGTTTPLWTLILAAFYWLGIHDLPVVALVISAIADGLSCYVLWRLAGRIGLPLVWRVAVLLLLATNAQVVTYATAGMESSLFILIVLSAFTTDLEDRIFLAGLLSGLALFARPEGLAVLAIIVLRRLLTPRLLPRFLAGWSTVALPWLAFATMYFGNPLPESMLAKTVIYGNVHAVPLGWLLTWLAAPGNSLADIAAAPSLLLALCWLVVGLVELPRLVHLLFRRPALLPVVAFAPGLTLAYLLSGMKGTTLFPWYHTWLVPFALLGMVSVVWFLTRRAPPAVGILAACLLLTWNLNGLTLWRGSNPLRPLGINLIREETYLTIGATLPPAVLVASPEIGALGWAAPSTPILDTAALVSPEARPFYPLDVSYGPLGTNAVPAGLIRQVQPSVIISPDAALAPPLLEAPWFGEMYHLVERIPCPYPAYGFREILIYQHQ